MSRFSFVTFPGGGNQPPTMGLAAELKRRGHDVLIAGYQTQRAMFEAAGFRFQVLPKSGDGIFSGSTREEIMGSMYRTVMANPLHLAEVPEVAAGCDVLVIDTLMFMALSAASKLPQPVAVLVHTAPGMFTDGVRRHSPLMGTINGIRQANGFAAVASPLELFEVAGSVIVCTLKELDSRGPDLSSKWHYVGPVFPPPTAGPDADLPWQPDDPRPLVLVSLTTHIAWGPQEDRLQRILDALADSPVRVLLTAGPTVDHRRLQAPPNASVRDFLPHAAVMPQVSVCVTHAGHGTITAALREGVAMVCLPNPMSDQPYLAESLAELGAGITVDPNAPPSEIRSAVERVLHEPAFRQAAGRLRDVIGEGGAAEAADRLEALVPVATV